MVTTRVLFAEDDRAMRNLVALALRQRGYEVHEARSGIDLLHLVEMDIEDSGAETHETVIVSDVRMRGLGGMEVLQSLGSFGWRSPVILITAFGDPKLHARARALGAHAVLDKPFELDALVEEIENAVRPIRELRTREASRW